MQPDEYKPLPPEAHAFLDGTLNAEQEADFRRRLDRDESLRTQVEGVRVALSMLKALPVKDPGPAFSQRVLGRVRESELIDRARRRIVGARAPLWQHVAQVAAGAVAAAVVLALVAPDWRRGPAPDSPANPLVDVVGAGMVEPNEDDLLPNLGEQVERLRKLSSHVDALSGLEKDSQRKLLRLELDYSDLQRRNYWLAGQLSGLPAERRKEYHGFLDSLDGALDALDRELTESASERRPVNLAQVSLALRGVNTPNRFKGQQRFSVRRFGTAASGAEEGTRRVSSPVAGDPELESYANVREAVYSNDLERILAACDAYSGELGPYKAGHFAKLSEITAVITLLHLGRVADAAARYELLLDRLKPEDAALLGSQFLPEETRQLQAARKDLHRDE